MSCCTPVCECSVPHLLRVSPMCTRATALRRSLLQVYSTRMGSVPETGPVALLVEQSLA